MAVAFLLAPSCGSTVTGSRPATTASTATATVTATAVATTGPESAGVSPGRLAAALEAAVDAGGGFTSAALLRHGSPVVEAYGPESGRDDRRPVWSVTKSVVSALVGIAVGDGLLDVHAAVGTLVPLPEGADPEVSDITLEHLLTMTSGLDWTEADTAYAELYRSGDWVAAMLARPVVAQPGTRFDYCSGCVQVLVGALAATVGDVRAFADQRLFAPLGLVGVPWDTVPDGFGQPIGGWGLALTTAELATFGQLYLDRGASGGNAIVPATWVETSSRSHIAVPGAGAPWPDAYGHLWWVFEDGTYEAMGRAGQVVLVAPERDVVVVVTAELSDAEAGRAQVLARALLDAVSGPEALPADPAGRSRLDRAIERFGGSE